MEKLDRFVYSPIAYESYRCGPKLLRWYFQIQVPFDTYFQVEPLEQFHDVVLMNDFMQNEAPEIWPPEKRTG